MEERIKKLKRKKRMNNLIDKFILLIMVSFWIFIICISIANSTELNHKFKSPSFNGINTSAHYLTIENQMKSRKDKIQSDIEAELLAKQREEENTLLSKFIRNFESRVYSQLSKQLVDQLFDGTGSSFGSFVLEGSTITYQIQPCDDMIRCNIGDEVIVMDIVDEAGSSTNITIPIGAGTF